METQNAASILSAYLRQAVELRGHASKQVQSLYNHGRGRPPLETDKICALLAAELSGLEKIYFILDGLDEIKDKSETVTLLEKLQAMRPCPKLLATSRHLPYLSVWFQRDATVGLYRVRGPDSSDELLRNLDADCLAAGKSIPGHTIAIRNIANSNWKLRSSYGCENCRKLVCVHCYDAMPTCVACGKPRSFYKWMQPSQVRIASHRVDIERTVDQRISRSDDLKYNIDVEEAHHIDLRGAIMKTVDPRHC